MYFQRYYLECLSHASFMIADETTKTAALIDPQRDVEIYLNDAAAHGFEIKHVILTHFHADFVSGHIELRDKLGATIYFGAKAEAEFDFHPLVDGDEILFGDVKLVTLETPGHTPEGISILLYNNEANSEQPYAVFTGDTLFLGDVGRPDLLASVGVTANELAEMLYDSLHKKLLQLPDETLVYPAHGAGSMCGKQLSDEAVSTLGEQRKANYALQPMSREEFIEMVEADQPEAPAYFAHDAMLNRQNRPNLETTLSSSLNALNLEEVLSLQKQGAQIVDVREASRFAAAHLRGSLNIGIEGKYATWAGTMLKKDVPIVVIAETERTEEAVMRLGRIGFDNVAGYLNAGMESLRDRNDSLEKTERISVSALNELSNDVAIVDIRTPSEWESGHIDGSINIPLNHLADRLREIPKDRQVVVHCQGGYRSSIAASLLQKAGLANIHDLVGGYKAWLVSQKDSSKQPENVGAS